MSKPVLFICKTKTQISCAFFASSKRAGNSREKVPGFYHQLAPAVPGECGGFVFEPNSGVVTTRLSPQGGVL